VFGWTAIFISHNLHDMVGLRMFIERLDAPASPE